MADGNDINGNNTSIPSWPAKMPLWQKVLCLFGYHKWEMRFASRRVRDDGVVLEPMRLRDQCCRCETLSHTNMKDPAREGIARDRADRRPTKMRYL